MPRLTFQGQMYEDRFGLELLEVIGKKKQNLLILRDMLIFFARMLIGVALSAEGTDSLAKELACEDWSCHMSKPLLMPVPPTYTFPHLGDGECRADYLMLISRSGWVGGKTSDALGASSAKCRRNPEDWPPIGPPQGGGWGASSADDQPPSVQVNGCQEN